MALSLTANQRQLLLDWLNANIHKCVYQASWTEYQRDENGDFVLVDSGQVDGEGNPIMERVVAQVHDSSFLALDELVIRLSSKLAKHFPEKMDAVHGKDLEAIVDPKVPQLLALAGVNYIGSSPRRSYLEYVNEDPDL